MVGEVTLRLRSYLAERLEIPDLDFAEPPLEYPDGWEAYLYRFRLRPSATLPAEFAQQLVLRIYTNAEALPQARREFAVLQHVHQLQFPVPGAVLLEEDLSSFGGPFLLITHVPGKNLLRAMLHYPWLLFGAAEWMAATQLRLHQLRAEGLSTDDCSVLTRCLKLMAALIEEYHLDGLRPGLQWLREHQPAPEERQAIVHLDFHPMNLLYQRGRPLAVLDWSYAGVGDIHADLGTTMMLFQCIQLPHLPWYERLAAWIGRWSLLYWYLHNYRRQVPLDAARLDYYRAWAALCKLCRCGQWQYGSCEVSGYKPASERYLRPAQIRALQQYFRKRTGVAVHL
jgi:aminoglycoside phosphotransferase (APT) family kinase protein